MNIVLSNCNLLYYILSRRIAQCYIALHYIDVYCIVLCCIVLHCIVLYYFVLYCSVMLILYAIQFIEFSHCKAVCVALHFTVCAAVHFTVLHVYCIELSSYLDNINES